MKFKVNVLFSIFLWFLTNANSNAATSFAQKWNISRKHSGVMENNIGYDMVMMQRIMGINGRVYPIADLTYIRMDRNKNDQFDDRELLENLRKGYNVKKWKVSKFDNVHYYQAILNDRSRAISVSVTQNDLHSKVTVANYRLGYKDFTEREIALLQKSLSTNFERKTTFMSFLIREAYANGFDLTGLLNSIGGQSGSVSGSPAVTSVVDSINSSGLNTNVNINTNVSGSVDVNATGSLNAGQFNAVIGQGNQINQSFNNASDMVDKNWGQTNTTLDNINRDINHQVGNLNQNIDKGIGMADKNWTETNTVVDKNWTDTNKMVDKNWSDTNKQLSRANSVAEKLSDPKHMFLLSGATAAGAVFGASLANLAIDGMQAGVTWIIDQITDRKGKAERWQLFSEARGNWEKTIKNAVDLERAMDQFLGYYDIFKELKSKFPNEQISMETILRHFSKETLLTEKKKKKYEDAFSLVENKRCEDYYADKILEQDAVLDSLKDVSNILSNHNKNSPNMNIFDERFFCTQMGEMMRNLLDAENALQDYRIYMIDGKAEYADKMLEQQERLVDKADRYNSKRDSIKERERDIASDSYELAKDEIHALAKADCKREGKGLFSTGECVDRKLASGNYATRLKRLEAHNKRAKSDIDRNYEDSDVSRLSVNEAALNDRMSSYKDWFKELEEQQFCFQNPEDSACKEISKFRYNGVFYVKDKAMNAMSDICKNEDLRLMDIRKVQNERSAAAVRDGAPKDFAPVNEGRSLSSDSSSSKGFFASLFDGIGNFFKTIADSIGDVFGNIFGGNKIVGEKSQPIDVAYVEPKAIEQINVERSQSEKIHENYRAPALVEAIESPFKDEEKILEKTPEAMAKFEELLLEGDKNKVIINALAKSDLSDNIKAAILMDLDPLSSNSINEIIAAYDKSFYKSKDGRFRIDLKKIKKNDNINDWRKFIEIYKKATM
ncbi:hypothetical protein M899_2624 [Bacteriovorax sp. BSW11_IV]|uniref:hypothetical protein n=1 Tax=Bacteriovorax sp. BSW11_IV TaxID=1353529 RepID=UPI000389E6A0|nr:hypothetical protein [Bacteriovorax sp. BSW11_IV]EQC49909.1 hypothetical protein M899_2624 [Bacteriovorax sp. BSW11_IV]